MKGQWFIISAVFVAFSMLLISNDLRSLGVIDSSVTAGYNEDQHFANLRYGLNRTVQLSNNNCQELAQNLDDYIYFSQQSKGRLGYIVDVFYQINDCTAKDVQFNLIMLQSAKYQIWEGVRPQIAGG